jgi:hypothetical protein
MGEFFSNEAVTIMLYLQTAYTVWVAVRSAKFFKIPYVLASSFWHHGPLASLPFKRKVANMVHDGPMIQECRRDNGFFESVEIGGRSVVTSMNENGTLFKALVDLTEVRNLRFLNSMMTDTVFSKERDLLLPGLTLVKSITKSEVFDLYLEGYRPQLYEEHCFVDQSSGQELNQDFMKLVSVFPIYLQAKDLNSESIVATLVIVAFDFFSYYPNVFWQYFKIKLFYFSKLGIAKMSLDARQYFHMFLSSISDGFMYSDFSSHKSYHTDVCELYVVEPCILPSYVERVIEVKHTNRKLANKDGNEHTYELAVNLDTHLIRYQYKDGYFRFEHKLNSVVIVAWPDTIDEDNFETVLSFYEDVKRMGIYPALTLTEEGVHLIESGKVAEELYQYRGVKVVVKKGLFVL